MDGTLARVEWDAASLRVRWDVRGLLVEWDIGSRDRVGHVAISDLVEMAKVSREGVKVLEKTR